MLFINNDDVVKVLTIEGAIEAYGEGLREYYSGDATCRPRIDVWAPSDIPDGYFRWGSMEGTSKRWRVFAQRVKSDIITFVQAGDVYTAEYYCQQPGKFCGLIFLFSLKNGEPLAMINDGILQHMRVGAQAGLLARDLALPGAKTVGMIGSGGMARTHAMAFKAVRDIQRIQVYSPTRANRERYAREMAAQLEVEVVPVESPQAAVTGAEIVSCCTDSIVPVVKGDWIEEGAFITTVKGAMELDDLAVARIDAAVGFPASPSQERKKPLTGAESHSLGGALAAYIAGQPEELAKIPTAHRSTRTAALRWISPQELALGTADGRLNEREIISSSAGGGSDGAGTQGIAFSSVGGLTYHLAVEKGLGREVPTDWFLQDIRN